MKKVCFLAIVVALMTTGGNAWSQHADHSQKQETPAVTKTTKAAPATTLVVQGSCGMCKTRIEKAAKGVEGVTSAAWDSKTKQLSLEFNAKKTSVDAISKAVAKSGHDTAKDKADDKTYNALPGCCKYRK